MQKNLDTPPALPTSKEASFPARSSSSATLAFRSWFSTRFGATCSRSARAFKDTLEFAWLSALDEAGLLRIDDGRAISAPVETADSHFISSAGVPASWFARLGDRTRYCSSAEEAELALEEGWAVFECHEVTLRAT